MRELRDQLARVGQDVARVALVVGSGGNLSAREPGSDEFWVTAAGTWLDELVEDSFVRVRVSDGSIVGEPRNDPTTDSPCTPPPIRPGPTSTRSSTCTHS